MKSEFEEKSYEAAFNVELGQGQSGLVFFAPGQRLEAHLGFDVAWQLGVSDPLWRAINLTGGAGLPIAPTQGHVVPADAFNLFIQYKRSDWLHGRRSQHRAHFGGDYYRFMFNHPARQLNVLQNLEQAAAGTARVVYAAPEFHTVGRLMDASRNGTVVRQSVLVEAGSLGRGHRAYNFKLGNQSLLNPEPELAKGSRGDSYFSELANSPGARVPWEESLSVLHSAITETPEWGRAAALTSEAQAVADEGLYGDQIENVRRFVDIQLFAWMNNLRWVTAG